VSKKLAKEQLRISELSFCRKHKDHQKPRGRVSADKFYLYYFPSDNKKTKTRIMITGKRFYRGITPPLSPHRNLVKKYVHC
jgi:hypothetical protein